MKKEVIGIDLFAGAGGLSLGAEMVGITVKYAIEKDPFAVETYKANHPQTSIIHKDIQEVKEFHYNPCNASVILFGGAPCQGFSSSNRRTNTRNNPGNWLYKEFLRMVYILNPQWIVFENVTGILEMESGSFFSSILDDFQRAGYTCSYSVLTASDFGVPQRRSRLFLVGSKNGIKLDLTPKKVLPIVTVGDAFRDLPLLENGANIDNLPYGKDPDNEYAKAMRSGLSQCSGNLVSRNSTCILDRYVHIRQGQNWEAIPPELMKNYTDSSRCHTGIYYRLREDQPSIVIGNYRKSMIIHPWSNRGLSVREAARLQSFPDWYVFKGSIGFQQQQVGNAVPPLLARYVFQKIIDKL